MGISAREAAEMVGLSKAGILKAIKTGKVSAEKDVHGEWRIQPVELFRVYAPVSATVHPPVAASPPPSLQREVDLLREMVTDLRQRLDDEVEERRKLTLLPTTAQPQPRSWWARLFGGE